MLLVDEVVGKRRALPDVAFRKPMITVRELLHARVDIEIEAVRDGLQERLCADPRHTPLFEARWTSVQPDRVALIREVEEAFAGNRFFLLLDDRQAEHLDEVVEIERTAEATFLLLTPLKGG